MFPVGFIQKIAKKDLIVKVNYRILPWHRRGKDLKGKSQKLGPLGHSSGPVGPLGRPPNPVRSPVALPFDVDFLTTFEDASKLLVKSV